MSTCSLGSSSLMFQRSSTPVVIVWTFQHPSLRAGLLLFVSCFFFLPSVGVLVCLSVPRDLVWDLLVSKQEKQVDRKGKMVVYVGDKNFSILALKGLNVIIWFLRKRSRYLQWLYHLLNNKKSIEWWWESSKFRSLNWTWVSWVSVKYHLSFITFGMSFQYQIYIFTRLSKQRIPFYPFLPFISSKK